jgi:hypothetical protein
MIPIDERKVVKPKMKLSSALAAKDFRCEVDDCSKSLTAQEAFVFLDKDSKMFMVSCDKCMKIASSIGKAMYYDTYEVFQKRKAIGVVEELYRELVYNEKGK